MKTKSTVKHITLRNPTGDERIERVLDIIGRRVDILEEHSIGGLRFNSYTLRDLDPVKNRESLIVKDAEGELGPVVGAFNEGDDLVLVALFYEQYEFSMLHDNSFEVFIVRPLEDR